MRQMMEGVVLRGTGRGLANLNGYTSGGKTGTAQIYDLKAHVYTHQYNASFLGFAPVSESADRDRGDAEQYRRRTAGFGGPVAAPVFRDVAMTALRMLDVPKDLPDGDLRAASAPKAAMSTICPLPGWESRRQPNNPLYPPSLCRRSRLILRQSLRVRRGPAAFFSAVFTNSLAGPKVPNFHGMTLRAVLEESSARGLQVETLGAPETGLVREQDPPAGAILPPGRRIRVQFVR